MSRKKISVLAKIYLHWMHEKERERLCSALQQITEDGILEYRAL
jgi:hypothetical protein